MAHWRIPIFLTRGTSVHDDLLSGVAANPAAPVEVLLRLLTPAAAACWDSLCRDRDLPVELVDAVLTHPDPKPRRSLARNPHVDPAQRARLIDDPDPRMPAWLATGPRWPDGAVPRPLPDDTIRRLLTMDLSMLTREELWSELFETPFVRRIVEIAATHPQPGPRALAAGSLGVLGPELQQALREDPDPQVRAAVAKGDLWESKVMQPHDLPALNAARSIGYRRLSRALIDQVIAAADPVDVPVMAGNPSLPADVVEALSRHPDPGVRCGVARRDDLTAGQLARLAGDDDADVRVEVSVHPGLSESQRAAITIESWPAEQLFVARHLPRLPDLEVNVGLAYSVNPLLRRRAARDPRLPHVVVARLAADPDADVRTLLALHHPAAPPGLLLRCFLDGGIPGGLRTAMLRRSGFPVQGLARYADHRDPMVRRLAPLDPQIDPGLVDALTRDPDGEVRRAAAGCPRLPADRVRALLATDLARPAAANPVLPVSVMHALLDEAGLPAAPPR